MVTTQYTQSREKINPISASATYRMVDAALDGARAGYRIIQCRPFSKLPLREGWKDWATANPDELRRQWRECPQANLAYLTGQQAALVVIDADGAVGLANLVELQYRYGSFPRTRRRRTPRGGEHLDFLYPIGRRIKNSVGKLAPRVDVRSGHSGAGGLAVGAGSVNRDGLPYVWIPGCGPDDVPIAPLPPAWAELLDDPPEPPAPAPLRSHGIDDERKAKRCRAYLATLEPSIAGQYGHDNILRASCEIFRFGLDGADAYALLAEFNLRSIPPWDETDLRRKLSEARKLVGNGFGRRLVEGAR